MSNPADVATVEMPRLTLRHLIHYMYRAWHDDRVSGLAAEIGFFALLSLFPILLVLSALLGWLGDVIGSDLATDVEAQLTDWSSRVFGVESGATDAVSDLFLGSSTSALTVGILATLYTASRGFAAVVRALDVAYGHDNTRGWVGTQVIGLLLAVGSTIVFALALAGLVIGPAFGRDDLFGEGLVNDVLEFLWIWFRYPVAFFVLVFWAATLYHVAPNRRASWRWEVPGALFAAVLWVFASWLFSLYVASLSNAGNAVFGVIGTAITIGLWLYLLAIGLILGAEFNGVLAMRRGAPANWTEPQLFTRFYRWVKGAFTRS
ncbi:MAG: YihY/virulence factor BrkB family protein [Acidimicrobiales bacterium]|nr:YihY/virulence factor BrkB family protein [Acidimicrobiales bacterium]RZV47725.1 MAG: YihY/virulence factor BrkB family protein [Acidimicrobiales bacterium]